MPRAPTLTRLLLLIAITLLAVAPSGCLGCSGEPGPLDADTLRQRFPEQASQVLSTGRVLVSDLDGFTMKRPDGDPSVGHAGLVARLPRRAADAVRFEL